MQRRYVWRSTRVRDLLDSLYRGYPSGAILLWETDQEVPLQDMARELKAIGYDGWLSLEWEKQWHPELDDADIELPTAAAYLQSLLQQVTPS